MKKRKLKYDLQLLGIYDGYGNPNNHSKYIKWMADECKGRWTYYSPDAKLKPEYKKPDDWPIFYEMRFYFSHKKDYDKFRKRFT